MENRSITVTYKALQPSELDPQTLDLVERAKKSTFRSYAPYSNFKVGAAIELDGGVVVEGANQENAAFPSGTCAERSACYYAGATYPGVKFRRIAIAARGTNDEFLEFPIAPCGACRQALLEYETLAGEPVEVILYGTDHIAVFPSVKSLLPLTFSQID